MRSTARLVGEERRDAHGERQGGVGEGMRPAVPSNDVRASSTRRVCASTRLTRPSRLASDGACTPARVYKPRWSLSLRPTRSRGCEMLARSVTQQSILSTKPRTGSVGHSGMQPDRVIRSALARSLPVPGRPRASRCASWRGSLPRSGALAATRPAPDRILCEGGRGAERDETKGTIYMQFRSRRTFLALVAILAMSAVTASAASAAAPEFKPSTKQAFTGSTGTIALERALVLSGDLLERREHG